MVLHPIDSITLKIQNILDKFYSTLQKKYFSKAEKRNITESIEIKIVNIAMNVAKKSARKELGIYLLKILITAFLLTLNEAYAQLNSAGTYVWNATDSPKVFNNRLQLSFVSASQGFQSYGTVIAGGGYSNTQDGAVFQMYFPYNPTYGGIAPQIRFGKYNNQGWGNWSTFFTSANANLATVDWSTKNLIAFGNVLIGKTSQSNSTYRLDVEGIIRSQKVIVNSTGADFVFDSGYNLLPIDSINNFIHFNHHLPNVPSAAEMQREGLDVRDNQMVLLQKIEELTLMVIEQQKEIEYLKNSIDGIQIQERKKSGY